MMPKTREDSARDERNFMCLPYSTQAVARNASFFDVHNKFNKNRVLISANPSKLVAHPSRLVANRPENL